MVLLKDQGARTLVILGVLFHHDPGGNSFVNIRYQNTIGRKLVIAMF